MPISPDDQPDQIAEIEELRDTTASTHRPAPPRMERHLYTKYPVLDHGFVRVIDYMGHDAAIVQAARVSYGKGTKTAKSDEGLIRYLMRHWHSTPFEMCEIKLHVKLPIFVARQWVRHRTASVNEYSARYSILDREFYIPDVEQIRAQSETNRQGRGNPFDEGAAREIQSHIRDECDRAYSLYQGMLDNGLSRELARMVLPSNIYTQWYWKVDLHNLFHFLRLRVDTYAQYEIRVYAEQIRRIVADWVPVAYQAFEDYRLGGPTLSRMGLDVLRRMLTGETVTQETSGMTEGEWQEFQAILPE